MNSSRSINRPSPNTPSAVAARASRYRVVVMDVDGTMVGPDFVVPDRLRMAVRRVQETGAVVSLATGRMMRSARRFARDVGAVGPVICYQGALTFQPDTSEVLRHERIGEGEARQALSFWEDAGVHVNLYLDDEVYVEEITPWAEGYASRMEIELKVVPSLADLAARGPTLILGVGETDRMGDHALKLTAELGERARVTHSLAHFCEVGSPNAGKEQALAHLSGMLGVPRTEFIAFGDGKGDAGMLAWAGLGVAIRGGHTDALAAAGRVTYGPDEDGVATVLEELLAEGRIGA